MKITLNHQKIETEMETLYDILLQARFPLSRTAVKVNNAIIAKGDWKSTIITENDNLETVILVSGG